MKCSHLAMVSLGLLTSACSVTPYPTLGRRSAPRPIESTVPTSAVPVSPVQQHKEWSFAITPYALFASISGDVSVGRASGSVDVDFDDILSTLDFGGMIHAEAQNSGGFGMILDYAFMELGADQAGPAGVVLDAEVRQGVLEAFLTSRIETRAGTLDLFGGVRWWDMNIDLRLSAAGPSVRQLVSEDWVDPVFGAILTTPLSDRWDMMLRGDIGGFYVGSEFSWTAAIGTTFKISEHVKIEAQYKALAVDYVSGIGRTRFHYDALTHGPLIGMRFEF